MENYAILVHAIKGDSKYLGFTKLAEMSLNHELKAKENDSQYVNDNYDLLINELVGDDFYEEMIYINEDSEEEMLEEE